MIKAAYPMLLARTVEPRPQNEAEATYWPGRKPEDGRIDLEGSVLAAERLVRALTHPYPGAFVERDGRRTIIWRACMASEGRNGSEFELPFRDGVLQVLEAEDGGPLEL